MKNIYNLEGKTALITGGSGGIGYGIAKEFLDLGAKVVITGMNKDKLIKAQTALGADCFAYKSDVTNKAQHTSLVQKIEQEVGDLEILVNNAGKHCKKPSLETTDAEFEAVLDTNLRSVFALTREALKVMIPRKSGSVINISSMTAIYGLTQVVAYSSSKTALLGLTRTLASEYSYSGVRINAIAPGFIESKMFLDIMEKDQERKSRILERTPMKKFGNAEDVGMAAAFLASEASRFVTGICLPVDGGNSIGF